MNQVLMKGMSNSVGERRIVRAGNLGIVIREMDRFSLSRYCQKSCCGYCRCIDYLFFLFVFSFFFFVSITHCID